MKVKKDDSTPQESHKKQNIFPVHFEHLSNIAEELVIKETFIQLKQLGEDEVAHCWICILDIVCFVLNHIRPLYRVTLKGAFYSKNPSKRYMNVLKKMVGKSIQKVLKTPSHDLPHAFR